MADGISLPTCVVCMEDLGANGGPASLTCGHNGCLECLQELQVRLDVPFCPLCRTPFDSNLNLRLNIDLNDALERMKTMTCVEKCMRFQANSFRESNSDLALPEETDPWVQVSLSQKGHTKSSSSAEHTSCDANSDINRGPQATMPEITFPEINIRNVLSGLYTIVTGRNISDPHQEEPPEATSELASEEFGQTDISTVWPEVNLPSAPPLLHVDEGDSHSVQTVLEAEPPQWVPDSVASCCMRCEAPFKPLICGRHHCRFCGGIFCRTCSIGKCLLPVKFREQNPQRVCDVCYEKLEPLQGFLIKHVSNASQIATHDVIDWTSLRRWLNTPLGLSMEQEIYKSSNVLRNYCEIARLKAEGSIPVSVLQGAKGLALSLLVSFLLLFGRKNIQGKFHPCNSTRHPKKTKKQIKVCGYCNRMADNNVNETAIAGRDAGESSDATVEIKIKTLDSQVYTLRVDRSMPVPALKEQIVALTGVPLEQQRLICRGKVLKDDQLLSDYHVEDGHTLHLVVRQPLPSSSSSSTTGPSGGDGTNEQQGTDPTAGTSHNRIGQVSHNVVFGSFNLQDQGEGAFPDLNRILSTVLNSIGVGNIAPGNVAAGNGPTVMPQGAASEGRNQADGANDVSQTVNQQQPAQAVSNVQSESAPPTFNIPSPSHLRLASQQMVIPDALTTLSQYLNRMVQAFSHDGYESQAHPFTSSTGSQDQTAASGLPSVSRGLPRPSALGSLIQHTQQLLSGPARDAFSQLAGLLEGESTVTDQTVRAQIQSVAMRDGILMQELGALLLELGRATLTLQMGQSHDESVVNAGPAVYISSSGPNPIMVQPQPFQHGGSFGPFHTGFVHPTAGHTGGIAGTGEVPRNINIHIHSGSTLVPGGGSVAPASNADLGNQTSAPQSSGLTSQVGNGTAVSRETGSVLVVPVRTVVAAVPVRPPTETPNATNNVFHPLLTRIQQMNSAQGVPIRGVAQATIEVQSSGIDGAQQQSIGTVNFDQAQINSILAQIQAQAQNLHGAIQTVNFQPQNADGGIQTRNSSSVSAMSSATNPPASVQRDTQNQSGLTTERELNQQVSSSENSGTDVDGRDRIRNDNNSNVAVAGSGEMENMVNAVLQQIMGTYGRSGRANQQQQQTTGSPSSGNELSSMTEEPKSPGKLLDDKKDVKESENTTTDVGPGLISTDSDMQECDLASIPGNAIVSTSCTSSQSEMLQPKSEKESSDAHGAIPVGLGLGGLQPLPSKKRAKQNRKLPANQLTGPEREVNSHTAPSGDKDSQSSIARGQNVLQALVSEGVSSDHRAHENGSPAQLPNGLAEMFSSMASGGHTGSGRVDVGDIMSQLLRTPTVNNFLRGVAEQTGTVPPEDLSNMMEQVTRSPVLRNTMQQMTEHLGEHSQEIENALSGMSGRQGGIDFSRMLQQMMPFVSQVLGRASGGISSGPGPETQSRISNSEASAEEDHEAERNYQINLKPTVQKLENHDPPQEVFRSMVENAMSLYTANDGPHNGANTSDVSHQLCDTEDLANEYLDMLNRDLITRLQSDSGSADNS